VTVSDGVTESDDGGSGGRSLHVDFGDLVPVVDVFGICECGSADLISVNVPGGGAGAGVAGFSRGRRLEVKREGEIGERRDGVVDGIGDEFGTGWNLRRWLAGECEGAIGGGIDGWR